MGWGWCGVGWGQGNKPGCQCARVCQTYPVANYPLVSHRIKRLGILMLSVLERSVSKTLVFPFGVRLHSKLQRSVLKRVF